MPRVTLVDGSIATVLVRNVGNIMDGHPLWCARFAIEGQNECVKAHKEFIRLGAEIIRSNTYQVTVQVMKKYLSMNEEQSAKVIKDAVGLARQAIVEEENDSGKKYNVKIAGSVGSYGASLHDGSEYTGSYYNKVSKDFLKDFHRSKLKMLLDAKVDLIAFETIPCIIEGIALAELLKEFPGLKAWLSFSAKNGEEISSGENFSEAAKMCWESNPDQLIAIGVNCLRPIFVTQLFTSVRRLDSSIPLIVYPNSGEKFDTLKKEWVEGECNKPVSEFVEDWIKMGVKYIGTCCRATPEDYAKIVALCNKYN